MGKFLKGFSGTILYVSFVLTPSFVFASTVTQGYTTTQKLPKGAVVSLTTDGSRQIEKSTIENDNLLIGITTQSNESLIDVRPKGTDVSVATSGEVEILVSDLQGEIKKGDLLIASTLSGIAVKDNPPAPGVKYIAVANSEFSANTPGATKIQIEKTDGTKKEVSVGLVNGKILLGSRSQEKENENALSSLGRKITGKAVSPIQLLAAGAIFIATITLTGVILQSSIRNSFVSLGRNPLSRSSIISSLVKVIILSVLALAAGVGVAYGILLL
jgi:hypothetical protein